MKKLKNQDGVSFVFALIALLVASVVSITVLTAAVTTVKRVSDDKITQQTRLDITSAAQLVRDEMKKTTVTTTDAPDSEPSYDGDFANIVETVMGSSPYAFTINDGDTEINVTVAVAANNDLTFTLEAGKEKAYLTMTAQSSTSKSGTGETKVMSWQTAVITGVTQ